jgi:pyruvate kinase
MHRYSILNKFHHHYPLPLPIKFIIQTNTSSFQQQRFLTNNNNNYQQSNQNPQPTVTRWDDSGLWESPSSSSSSSSSSTPGNGSSESAGFMAQDKGYGQYFRIPNPNKVMTKIICTLGPASTSDVIERLLTSGMSAARLNTAHGNYDVFDKLVDMVRTAAVKKGVICPIILDTKGPEIRVGKVLGGGLTLENFKPVELVYEPPATSTYESTPAKIGVSYEIGSSVTEGDVVLLDNGRIALSVRKVWSPQRITCRVISGGVLKSNKGVNLPGCEVHLPHVTEKDKSDIAYAVSRNIEYIAHSFTRSGEGIRQVRELPGVKEAGIHIIAKIESQQGLDNFSEILQEADGIMVARGDLGVEIPLERVCSTQKRIIRECNLKGKFVITATEMLESMIYNLRPTRAEASDVANACYDGTDCVMLSGETAVGDHPVESVQVMSRICKEAETDLAEHDSSSNFSSSAREIAAFNRFLNIQSTVRNQLLQQHPTSDLHVDGNQQQQQQITTSAADTLRESFSKAAVKTAKEVNASVILCLTKSGSTAKVLARYRPSQPVLALTTSPKVCAQISLYHSVRPVLVSNLNSRADYLPVALAKAKALGLVKKGSRVVLLYGLNDTQKTLETYIVQNEATELERIGMMRYRPGASLAGAP